MIQTLTNKSYVVSIAERPVVPESALSYCRKVSHMNVGVYGIADVQRTCLQTCTHTYVHVCLIGTSVCLSS